LAAVRDRYGEISVMRERGLSWADIAEELAREGATTRDGQAYPAVTLRSAFFLVTNEARGDRSRSAAATVPSPLSPAPQLEFTPPEAPFVVAEVVSSTPTTVDETSPTAETVVGLAPERERGEVTSAEPPEVEEALPNGPPPPTLLDPAPTAIEPTAAPVVAEETIAESTPLVETAPRPGPFDGLLTPAPRVETPAPEAIPPTESTANAVVSDPVVEPKPIRTPEVVAEKLRLDMPERIAENAGASELPTESVSPSEHLRGHHMLGTIFVLNDRGGVGKTLLSHHLMATAMLEGLQLRVVEYEVNERLARLYGPELVEHRRITQDFMNLMGSGDGFFEYWDQIGPELQRGGRLFDFGGNISQWFFNWAEVSGFDYYVGEGERLTFMVPVTVDLASLQTGMSTLDRIAVIAPKAKRVLVENGISGPFSQLEESQYGRRKAELVEREGVEVISMPSCSAPAWARLTGHRLDQVAKMTREDLVKLGMTPPVASRSLIIIHEWLRGLRISLSPFVHEALRASV